MNNTDNLKKRNLTRTEEENELLEKLYGNFEEDDDITDDEMPYGGRIYLARKKKGDSWACITLQVIFHSLSIKYKV